MKASTRSSWCIIINTCLFGRWYRLDFLNYITDQEASYWSVALFKGLWSASLHKKNHFMCCRHCRSTVVALLYERRWKFYAARAIFSTRDVHNWSPHVLNAHMRLGTAASIHLCSRERRWDSAFFRARARSLYGHFRRHHVIINLFLEDRPCWSKCWCNQIGNKNGRNVAYKRGWKGWDGLAASNMNDFFSGKIGRHFIIFHIFVITR